MYFIGHDDTPMGTLDPDTPEKQILVYDISAEDYFMEYLLAWNMVSTPIYTVLLGEEVYQIPSSTYVICGEAGGTTDVIIFEEIIGREIDLIVVTGGWRKIEWHVPRILSIDPDGKILYPMSNKLIPFMGSGGSGVILTSGSDRLGGKKLEYEEFAI